MGVGGEWGGTEDNSQVSNSGALLEAVVPWASAERAVGVGGRTGTGSKHLREVTALWSVHNLHDMMHTTCRVIGPLIAQGPGPFLISLVNFERL